MKGTVHRGFNDEYLVSGQIKAFFEGDGRNAVLWSSKFVFGSDSLGALLVDVGDGSSHFHPRSLGFFRLEDRLMCKWKIMEQYKPESSF